MQWLQSQHLPKVLNLLAFVFPLYNPASNGFAILFSPNIRPTIFINLVKASLSSFGILCWLHILEPYILTLAEFGKAL